MTNIISAFEFANNALKPVIKCIADNNLEGSSIIVGANILAILYGETYLDKLFAEKCNQHYSVKLKLMPDWDAYDNCASLLIDIYLESNDWQHIKVDVASVRVLYDDEHTYCPLTVMLNILQALDKREKEYNNEATK